MDFFGTNNPYQAMNSMSAAFEEMTLVPQPKPGKQKVHEVLLTLEELFHGCIKKVRHSRKAMKESGAVEEHLIELTIDVKPGTPEGTRFVFDGMGNIVSNSRRSFPLLPANAAACLRHALRFRAGLLPPPAFPPADAWRDAGPRDLHGRDAPSRPVCAPR